MEFKMPVKVTIKEPESTPTSNESRQSEPGGTRRGGDLTRRFPPDHLRLDVVMTFSGDAPRLKADEIGVDVEGSRIEDAFRRLIEATMMQLASSQDARAELLSYPPSTWFRFVAPDKVRDRPPRADFWPEDEDVDDFIAAATEGRYEEEDEPGF